MISRLILKLQVPCDIIGELSSNSLFKKVLLEHVDSQYVNLLKKMKIKPYSQSIHMDKNIIKWTICTLNKKAREEILLPFLYVDKQSIYIADKGFEIQIIDKSLKDYEYKQLIKEKYLSNGNRFITIQFSKPTMFISRNQKNVFPDIKNIFEDLMKSYDNNSKEENIYSLELLNEIDEGIDIIKYKLESAYCYINNKKVSGYKGRITIKVTGSQKIVNLVNLLLGYAEYSGIGMNTDIGMGKVKILKSKNTTLNEKRVKSNLYI